MIVRLEENAPFKKMGYLWEVQKRNYGINLIEVSEKFAVAFTIEFASTK